MLHWGGTRNGAIVHWPKGFEAKGELRTQFHHVIDVAPTVLEAAGLPEPTVVHGVEQRPIEGVSMAYAFEDASAAERRTTQYFEMFVNRGIYHDGWTAVTRHSTPWVMGTALPPIADDVWELYDTLTPCLPRPRRFASPRSAVACGLASTASATWRVTRCRKQQTSAPARRSPMRCRRQATVRSPD